MSWRSRDYLLLWGGQTVSLLGGVVSGFAFPLLVLSLTGSPAKAGLAGGLERLPYALLALPAGVLVDRWDRKRLMVACDAGRAVALAGIAIALWSGHVILPLIY